MVALREITWEEVSAPEFGESNRAAWREAVAEIAEKAKAKLPECNGRVDSAVKIVLAGDVELLPDGKARVASQSNGSTEYVVCNGHCECKDFPHAPSGWCKHRIAAGMQKRAHEKMQAATPEAEAVQGNAHGIAPEHIVEIQGKRFVKFAGLLALAHARGLLSLTCDWTFNSDTLSLAKAVAVFEFGRFEECGDATPENVTKKVAPHFRRVALTRAKARVLRDALNIDMVSLEELSE